MAVRYQNRTPITSALRQKEPLREYLLICCHRFSHRLRTHHCLPTASSIHLHSQSKGLPPPRLRCLRRVRPCLLVFFLSFQTLIIWPRYYAAFGRGRVVEEEGPPRRASPPTREARPTRWPQCPGTITAFLLFERRHPCGIPGAQTLVRQLRRTDRRARSRASEGILPGAASSQGLHVATGRRLCQYRLRA